MCLPWKHKWKLANTSPVQLTWGGTPIGAETHLLFGCTICGAYKTKTVKGYHEKRE